MPDLQPSISWSKQSSRTVTNWEKLTEDIERFTGELDNESWAHGDGAARKLIGSRSERAMQHGKLDE